MEPSAHELAEISSEVQPPPPIETGIIAALGTNGHGSGPETEHEFGLRDILHALQAVRFGDFSVRLPNDCTGLAGKVADTFNEIVAANQQMAEQLAHVGQVVGREGKTRQRVQLALSHGAWGAMESSVNTLIEDLLVADQRGHSGDHGGCARRPAADRAARCRWTALAGRVFPARDDRQHDDRAALGVHVGGHARRARGRHRRQARRPGAGARGHGRMARPDRERQFDGLEPDGAGPQHRRCHDRGCQRRPVEKDHRRCARRNPAAQGGHQHDGRSAALVRLGGDARRARGRYRRQAGRSGDRAGGRRNLEGLDRLGQCDGRQPDGPGPQHRRSDDGGRARRPRRARSRWTCRAKSSS